MIGQFLDMNRRDLLLQQMGVQQWQLHRPEVLQGALNMEIAESVRLLILTEQPVEKEQALLQDVVRSLELSANQWQILSLEQLQYVQISHALNCWLLAKNSEKIDRTLALLNGQTAPRNLWQSPDWQSFQQQPQQKRALWQQIQQSKPLE